MSDEPHAESLAKSEIERLLLSALCRGTLAQSTRAEVVNRLATHEFIDPEHEIVFVALTRLGSRAPQDLRAALGTGITRLGFPDYDLEPFFDRNAPDEEEVKTLLRHL